MGGQSITYDNIGNPTSYYNGTRWTMEWEHGRELRTLSAGSTTWTNTYNADGLRIRRTDGTNTYNYVYLGGQLVKATYNDTAVMYFAYDAEGRPMSVKYNGTTYYYVTNLQGDVVGIVNQSGNKIVSYTYDAWGNLLSTTGSSANTLGKYNPLRYRGYVYDRETGFYYLQSRYYDPEIGRFINADNYPSTGQGLLGNNMFAYCNNNPVIHQDSAGAAVETVFDILSLGMSIVEVAANPRDPWAWAGLAGDLIDVAVPFVGGIGEATRALKVASNASEAVSDVRKGWKVGDDITNLTKAGKKPSWTTVRQRYWKNEAHFNPQNYTDDNLKLMKQGRAPLVQYNGKLYPMELHHKIPRHKGGSDAFENLLPVTPWEHAKIDDYRHFKP